MDRLLRNVLAKVMPNPRLFRLALIAARMGRPFTSVFDAFGLKQVGAMLRLVPTHGTQPQAFGQPGVYQPAGAKQGRVALLMGCVQSVMDPEINAATIRLLTRLGYEVVVSSEESCCGSLTHHMGKEEDSFARAKRSIDQWIQADVDNVIITASGCGTTIKDYGHMLRLDPSHAEKAKVISAMARDITEFLAGIDLPEPVNPSKVKVAYHSACSMQHGQKIKTLPQQLLRKAGFSVVDVPEGHLCCGSAGTYNILHPEIATKLRDRKVANIESTGPDVIATGNIGCITQIAAGTRIPIIHTIQLLDWAYGGPAPDAVTAR
jgi:glycolate oxidase iron-sulfur subunit